MLQARNFTLLPQTVRQSSVYVWLSRLYWLLIVYPFEEFFLRGYWRNKEPSDICASITGHRSDYWLQHMDACQEIVAREFDSYVSVFEFFLYTLVIVTFFCKCVNKVCK